MKIRYVPFLDVVRDASGGNSKVAQSDYLPEGLIPVIDQGKSDIAGYVNDSRFACNAVLPAIVFGDHTRVFKYVDFCFAMGADGTKVLVPKVESDTKYLYYALQGLQLPSAGYSRHFKFLKETKIPLPPLAEQKRIAGILDAADALRAKRRAALAQLDALAQSLFLDRFGDPVTNPRGWEVVPLNSVAELENGDRSSNYPSGTDILESGVLFLSTKNISGSRLVFEKCQFISEAKFQSLSRGKLRRNDLVITLRGTLGSCAIFDCEFDTGFINAQILILHPGAKIVSTYLHALLTTEPMKRHFEKLATGVAVRQLTGKQIGNLSIPLPPLPLQQSFAAAVESIEKQKARHREHLAGLDALFASLQHRAFRGEL